MKYYAYVLQSEIDGSFYKGHTENLENRLNQHNSGKTISTKQKVPWKIIYFEEFEIRESALKREKYFKSAAGRRFLSKKLN
jgi:putative endonuclease